ncbi:hypothetical protein IAU60_006657 [Kwoniella sp. DSM 27419]
MGLQLKPRPPLPGFTFSLASPPTDAPTDPASSSSAPPRPPGDFIPEKDMYMFGTYPLLGAGEVGRGMVRCKRCSKVALEWAAGEHRRICNHVLDGTPLTTKKVTKASKTTEVNKKRRASEASETQTSPKKRAKLPNPSQPSLAESTEPEDEDERSPSYKGLKKNEIKKLEREKLRLEKREAKEKERLEIAERKRQRATNPVDLDQRCGVINDKGIPCARSLTCKTHTVGAKRAVQGRTRPYDLLYLEWQREHNPNFKEPQKKELNKDKKGDTAGAKKKKFAKKNGDEGLEEDEDGLRELEELVGLTRMAGERVRGVVFSLGQPRVSSGGSPKPPGVSQKPSGPTSGGVPGPSKANSANKVPTLNVNGSMPSAMTIPVNTIPFQSIWRSSASEFAQVGQMLTKALAARSHQRQPAQGHAFVHGAVGVPPGTKGATGHPMGGLKLPGMAAGTAAAGPGEAGMASSGMFGVTA